MTFELDSLRKFAESLKADRPELVITPMVLPILSLEAALSLSRRLSISIAPELLQGLARDGVEAGWRHFSRLAQEIAADPLFDGVAVMTPMDMDEAFATRLAGALSPLASLLAKDAAQ